MQLRNFSISTLAVIAWLLVVAIGIALATQSAVEPPFWDALSYAQKSKIFWDYVAAGHLVNPFAIERTIRPPGVIPISYPFGFNIDFRGFYFRWTFLPIVLLASAALIAGREDRNISSREFLPAALALVLAGMPLLYQFQPNEMVWSLGNWGLVDGFLAGLSALATAAILHSVRKRSVVWATTGAFVSAYGLYIKPSGLILMGLVGISWLILIAEAAQWKIATVRTDSVFRRFVVKSLGIAAAIYAAAVIVAFVSPYYSAQNIQFGIRNLEIFHKEVVYNIHFNLVASLLYHSTGWLTLAVIAVGVGAAMFHRRHVAAAVLSLLIFIVGVWFWIFTTNIGDVRYFLPFVAMAFVLAIPSVLVLAERAAQWAVYAVASLVALPTLTATVMLLAPHPPAELQRYLGINLVTNFYQPENEQASRFLSDLAAKGGGTWQIYIFDTSYVTCNFGAVIDYHNAMDQGGVFVRTLLPVDWQRGLAFRFDELVQSDYIAFETMPAPETRQTHLSKKTVANYDEQYRLMNAWATTIGPDEGVELVSETRLRLMRVVDRDKLTAALTRFAVQYDWPQPFRDANAEHWWKPPERNLAP